MFTKVTPILIVEAIEPCLSFWERLGFQTTVTVPHGEHIGFAILVNGPVELMYQTFASLAGDVTGLTFARGGITYIEVDEIKKVEAGLSPESIAVPLRKTFYGAWEIFAYEPGGNLIGFAQQTGDGG